MCTGIRLKAKNNGVAYGRTLEFGKEVHSKIIVIPRNTAFKGTSCSGAGTGLAWKSTYAVVGANALDIVGVIDGVNEQGLAGGLFYFSGYAQYQDATPEQSTHAIASWEMLTWILTNFSTVKEVRAQLSTIRVVNAIFDAWGIVIPVHVIVHDATGASLVIEYVQGVLHMYDNPLGVITNAPTFDWHLTNLENYIILTNQNSGSRNIGSLTLAPLGQGSGMLGLPGDFTSPSRFIRAVAYSQSVVQPDDEQHARDTIVHILDLFSIPIGVIKEQDESDVLYDYTQWTSVCDLTNKRYYFHTYANRQLYSVDLRAVASCDKPMMFPMDYEPVIIDCVPQ